MPVAKLKEFLDSHNIKYVVMSHSPAYTAQAIAAAAHVSGKELAKTVMVKVDGKMASFWVDLDLMRDAVGAELVEIATEDEFQGMFPGCEVGAMPPFGNLYGMDVFAAQRLAEDEEIVFNAGSHTELIKLAYADFERLVRPTVLAFSSAMR